MIVDEAWGGPFVEIKRSKFPKGCVGWVVTLDAASVSKTVTVTAVDPENEVLYQVDGEYSNHTTGLWIDPRKLAERLAQMILWGAVLAEFQR